MSRRDDDGMAFGRIVERVRNDRPGVLTLDDDAAQDLGGEEVTRMFTALADIGGAHGLLQQIGPLIGHLAPGYLDEFATLCRVSDALYGKREAAILSKAEDTLDGEFGYPEAA